MGYLVEMAGVLAWIGVIVVVLIIAVALLLLVLENLAPVNMQQIAEEIARLDAMQGDDLTPQDDFGILRAMDSAENRDRPGKAERQMPPKPGDLD